MCGILGNRTIKSPTSYVCCDLIRHNFLTSISRKSKSYLLVESYHLEAGKESDVIVSKIGATRRQILRLKCTKFDFGAGGAYSAPRIS